MQYVLLLSLAVHFLLIFLLLTILLFLDVPPGGKQYFKFSLVVDDCPIGDLKAGDIVGVEESIEAQATLEAYMWASSDLWNLETGQENAPLSPKSLSSFSDDSSTYPMSTASY